MTRPTTIPKPHPCSPSPPPVPGRAVISPLLNDSPDGASNVDAAEHGVATPRSRSSPSATPTWKAAAAHATQAAHSADRPDQSLGIAALAHAYDGNLRAATSLNDRFAAIAISPTLKGFHSYVAGEIDALAGRTDRAEHHYQRATTLSRDSGATFLEAIASVGHVTALASAGRLAEALDGYHALIDYWARTGGWIQQWTTLRNLARLLRTIGDQETAIYLDAAANHAPDAPPITEHPTNPTPPTSPRPLATLIANAATASRDDVIAVAHRALNHHRRPGFRAHNPKVVGSNPAPAISESPAQRPFSGTSKRASLASHGPGVRLAADPVDRRGVRPSSAAGARAASPAGERWTAPGDIPTVRLNARLNAASDS